ncbi:methyl-accepting chemotaxis protein [Aquabacterium sp. OR-4]|uniref:methyl-accepting chemotaxis protein n=1 Tax=Aquabacterium sp. OR-4 TaxID=2978127 RepID=UPI0021B44CBD|nr:methyl-accepting chemotaxis protein [Aquabacterium sp. OR-4]MDT7835389.1 methyl-accepting chemotaxis protein [Aquabacterium sp. OR-4]
MSSSEQYVKTAFADTVATPTATERWRSLRMPLIMACATAMPALLLHAVGWWAAGPSWLLAGWALWRAHSATLRAGPVAAAEAARHRGVDDSEFARLATQILPVWRRNLEAARSHSERSMTQMLESFAGVSGQLDEALSISDNAPTLELGAHAELMETHRPQLDELLSVARKAMAAKTAMQGVLNEFSRELSEMAMLTRDVQNIGRATHLLALNTSVEATRAGTSSGGFMAVAQEVRTLAGNSREAGSRLSRHVTVLQERLTAMQLDARRVEADDEELRLCIEQGARSLVTALLDSLGDATRATRNLQGVGRQLQGELERVLVGMQSQDRQSQMIESVTDDMARASAHLQGARDPLVASPPDWLARLEESYTMEDMRSSHHGTTAVDQNSSVEFF